MAKLQWSFGSKGEPPVEGAVENGQLQTGVRLRLADTDFKATVRIVGTDGSVRTTSRTFSTLRPPSDGDSREVTASLKKLETPPVFAVGDVETLTTQKKACAPMKIWSGEQKISGCFKPIESLGDIPGLERGAIAELGKELKLDETKRELMQKATKFTDGYVAEGRALLNDKFPVIPTNAADVLTLPQAKSLISAKAEIPVGSASFNPKDGLNLKLDPKKANIPLGKLPSPPKLPRLGGLEIVGDFDVDLEKREAKIKASIVFPKEITKNGLKLENEVILRATPDEIIVDEVRVGPTDAEVGAVKVEGFKIEYKRAGDEWLGQAKVTFAGAGIGARVQVKGGRIVFLGANVTFPRPGIPIFKGVFMEKVGFGAGFDPTRFTGSVGVGVLQVVSVDGRLLFAFPSSRTPYTFRREEAGNEFPGFLEGAKFTRTTIGAAGSVAVQIPAIGRVQLASGYVVYEFPGYIATGGGFKYDFLDVVSLDGSISGELDVDKAAFNLHGTIGACVVDIVCGRATGNISRGPGGAGGARGLRRGPRREHRRRGEVERARRPLPLALRRLQVDAVQDRRARRADRRGLLHDRRQARAAQPGAEAFRPGRPAARKRARTRRLPHRYRQGPRPVPWRQDPHPALQGQQVRRAVHGRRSPERRAGPVHRHPAAGVAGGLPRRPGHRPARREGERAGYR